MRMRRKASVEATSLAMTKVDAHEKQSVVVTKLEEAVTAVIAIRCDRKLSSVVPFFPWQWPTWGLK